MEISQSIPKTILHGLAFVGLAVSPLVLTGCETPQPKITATATRQIEAESIMQKIAQEVKRLANTEPEGSLIKQVYSGNLKPFSNTYSNLSIGVANPNTEAAKFSYGNFKYSPKESFSFVYKGDSKPIYIPTLTQQEATISFVPGFLSMPDEVKLLLMEKEGSHIPMFSALADTYYRYHEQLGTFRALDPTVTRNEMAESLVIRLTANDKDLLKLYDYAGYLYVLERIQKLVDRHDPRIDAALAKTNYVEILNMAKSNNIPIKKYPMTSDEFKIQAFMKDSPWGKMILDPKVPFGTPTPDTRNPSK